MKLCVRLHNSDAGTGLLRRVNLLFLAHSLWRSNITMLTLVTWLYQSWHEETAMMPHGAGQTIYISITVCTRLTWPPMVDAIDHSQQHCNTQWDLVVYLTDGICCVTTQKREFPALLCRQRDDALWQEVSHECEDISFCRTNNDQDCKNRGRLCFLYQRALFHEIDGFTATGEYLFSLRDWVWLYRMAEAWLSEHVPQWTLFLLFGSHLPSLPLEEVWHTSGGTEACRTFADLHPEDVIIEVASWGIAACPIALGTVPVLSATIDPSIHPYIQRHIHVCDYVHVLIRNTDTRASKQAHGEGHPHNQPARMRILYLNICFC